MVDLVDDRKALTHLLDKVLVLDEDAPIMLALKKAGVQQASDFVSLQIRPLSTIIPRKVAIKLRKMSPYLWQKRDNLWDSRSTFAITQKCLP